MGLKTTQSKKNLNHFHQVFPSVFQYTQILNFMTNKNGTYCMYHKKNQSYRLGYCGVGWVYFSLFFTNL